MNPPSDTLTPMAESGAIDQSTTVPLSKRDLAPVIARIQALMEYWGITLADLESDTPTAIEAPATPQPLPVKYRHPVTGETWDGQGPHPDWLRRALLKEGMRVEELKPDSPLNMASAPADPLA